MDALTPKTRSARSGHLEAVPRLPPADRGPAGLESWQRWMILITAALGALLEIIDTSIVNVALTDMQASLGATLDEVAWVVTSYSIANVIVLPLSAWLGSRFGKKRYFVFSLVGFTLSSMLCGLSTNLWVLVCARVLQGLCGGGLLAKGQAILFETFPKEQQNMVQAIFGICVITGPAIGPTLGGYLVTNWNWRWIFFINLPVGILATAMALQFLVRDTKKEKRQPVDWWGIGLLSVAVGSLQTVLEEGQRDDWFQSPFIATLSVLAVLGLVFFIHRELTTPHPAVDLRVLRHRSMAAGSMFSMTLGMVLYGALFAVPVFAQSILGFTALQTGLLLLPGSLCSGFVMPVVGLLSRKFDARTLIITGSLGLGLSMYLLKDMSPDTGTAQLFWPLLLRGGFTVFMFLPLTLATLGPVPVEEVSGASGIFNLTRQLGGSIGVALLTTLLTHRTVYHRAVLAEHVGGWNPLATGRLSLLQHGFQSRGVDPSTAKHMALAVLDGLVRRQSAIQSYGDTFWVVGAMLLVSLPLVFFLGSGRGAKLSGAAH